MVELADTLDLGSSAKAWEFKSPYPHQGERFPAPSRRERSPFYPVLFPGDGIAVPLRRRRPERLDSF